VVWLDKLVFSQNQERDWGSYSAHKGVTQRGDPVLFTLATLAVSGLLVVLTAHSHSGSQFLLHLPQHWKSFMCPPHCGQTRLMIEEIMLAFGSPGIVSMCLIVSLPSLTTGFSSKVFRVAKMRGAANTAYDG